MRERPPLLPFPDEEEEDLFAPGSVPAPTEPGPDPAWQPPDAADRFQALDIQQSFIVEAPAGSGKTGLLIQRYLKLLTDESVTSPEQVLAITFTLKATAELRDRVLNELGAPGLASETWEVTPQDSPNAFTLQTRTLARAVLERDRQLGWHLLDHPHRLNIRTIDSVCAQIARTLPVLSGSGDRLTPTEHATPLFREAARRTLLLLGGNTDPLFDAALRNLILHRDGNLADCETLLAEMLQLRDQWGALIPLTHPQLDDASLDATVLPRLQRTLEKAICAELTQLAQIFPADILEELTELAAEMAHSDGHKGEPSPIALCKGRTQSPGPTADDLEHWRSLIHILATPSSNTWRRSLARNHLGFAAENHHKLRLENLVDQISHRDDLLKVLCRIRDLPPAQYPANQWAVAKSLFRVLSRALVELQLVFAERGQCDFTELSLLARTALTAEHGPEDLASALGARLQHLLVDEMQDTSAGQYDLLELLTGSWDGASQTVFLVGDPRQSIYLFRQARVVRFLETMRTRRLGDLPLTPLRLTANFRSQQTLVEEFNDAFRLIFPQADPAETLPYTDAQPTLPPSPVPTPLHWYANPIATAPGAPLFTASSQRVGYSRDARTALSPSSPEITPPSPAQLRQRQYRRDAQEILRIARHWLTKPLPPDRTKPWQIAVLVRTRSHLTEIVAAFDRAPEIPYRAVDITPLNERQEVLDLTALTRALLHPADRVAWLAVLRAPWCGLSLADLHTLTGADSDNPTLSKHAIQRILADRGHLLPEESCQRLQRVWRVLSAATTQRARLTTAQLVERTWRSLGGDAWLTAPQLVNTRRFFQLLDQMQSAQLRIDATTLNDRLQKLFAEPNPVPPGQPFVELLTIHKAKGLEWDVVIVPALERNPGINRARLLTWSELDSRASDSDSYDYPAPIMLAPIAAKGEEIDPLTTWLKRIHRDREAAERKRLFYVASTRAREELHLFAAPDLTARGDIRFWPTSLLKAAWPAAQPHFTTPPAATTPGVRFIASLAVSGPGAPEPGALEPALSLPKGLASETWARATDDNAHPQFTPAPQPFVLDFAASADENATSPQPRSPHHPTLQRLPLTFDPNTLFANARTHKLPYSEPSPELSFRPEEAHFASAAEKPATPLGNPLAAFARPEASFAARSLGTAVHTFLELLAARIAAGTTPAALLAELPSWTPRIAAILRADGLAPATVDRLTRDTRTALENTLRDPDGQWLLAPHPSAATELALTAADTTGDAHLTSIRIDRTFHAGPTPRSPGEDFLWIVDYKTTPHSPSGLEQFLEAQRATYAPQLEAYARILARTRSTPPEQVRLALYYPTIPRLIWWTPVPISAVP